jgi:hypothetical protein
MPVIGGYLAFIGFFCGQAGLAMMAGVQVINMLGFLCIFSDTMWFLLYNQVTSLSDVHVHVCFF